MDTEEGALGSEQKRLTKGCPLRAEGEFHYEQQAVIAIGKAATEAEPSVETSTKQSSASEMSEINKGALQVRFNLSSQKIASQRRCV